jgi:hypothetical protein
VVVILVKTVDTAFVDLAMTDERLWPLVYAGSVFGAACTVFLFWFSGRERRVRPEAEVAA